ncbi:MAG: ABC transporter ATP-binding protein [Lachnospiraceae bacterium]|nr:ABC transporter ATP-binding protein [Lachnospiraceae bacterium]
MIETRDLVKRFDKYTALNGINARITNGCIYGMVGSNGAGKSTFLRLVTGVYRPDGGEVLIDGEPVFDNPAVKSRLAFVPDDLYFLNSASMRRMARLYASIYPGFDWNRFDFLAQSFRLDPTRPIATFSKGMKRQAAIIMALSCRPDYMFFDETFDGLDPVMRGLVKGLICEDVADKKATAIITSHSLRELEDICDHLALLHEGGVILESEVQDLKTALFKVQLAFLEPFDRSRFAGVDLLHYQQSGSVANLIIRGNREETVEKLRRLEPVLLDVLPLTLEEVFTYEMKKLGYSFDDVLGREEESHEQKAV